MGLHDGEFLFAGQRLRDEGVELTDLTTLLRTSDVVCLTLPLTELTRGMIGRSELQTMKPTAFLVNVARGGILDEDALFAALRGGRIAGAALDVRADENGPTPLAGLPNVVLTPHIGATTAESQRRIGEVLVDSLVAALRGETVANRIC